ncbi:MAG: type IV pilus secretin PilQ [Pyrinomonadaceae bacterium]|nr:type IV pilus secretin PilQ [Pyrinomonadaceae bacterium]
MNSLNNIGETIRRIALALTIVLSLAVIATAQTVDAQQQGKYYGEPGFRGEPINLNVVNADIRDILSYITDQYGINFVIDKSVKEVPVTVKVNDVPWNLALDSVLQSQELGVQVNGTILRVADNKTLAAEGELYRERMNNQLDTSQLYTEFVRLNYARAAGTLSGDAGGGNALSTGTTNSSSGGGGSAGGAGGAGTDQGILGIVKKRLSRRGTVEVDGRSNTLIITDVRQNIEAIKQLVSLLDQPEPQVEIEARIVVASRNFSRDIGVQLGAFINGSRGSGLAGGTLPNNTVLLPPRPGVPNPSINDSLFSSIANTAIGLTTGIMGTVQLNALISAGEQKGQAKIIATPRVSTLNNRPAEIKSGTKIPVTTIQPGSSTGGAVIATTTYVDVPLRLAVTPQITDQGSVILNVIAENSSTASIVGGANPAINTQSMQTQVTVPDGGTTVVGGVLFDDERESQDRTPGVASIPILGNLFKRKGVQRNTNEILFFITPRIIRPDAATAGSSAPKQTTIIQPVPMGNPPSNSTPVEPTPQPIVFQAPTMARPEQASTATPPSKPNN